MERRLFKVYGLVVNLPAVSTEVIVLAAVLYSVVLSTDELPYMELPTICSRRCCLRVAQAAHMLDCNRSACILIPRDQAESPLTGTQAPDHHRAVTNQGDKYRPQQSRTRMPRPQIHRRHLEKMPPKSRNRIRNSKSQIKNSA